ncbi:MAG: peptidoglycan-associated lipoprotein Pal [Burkholderiaceae bacterium]
MSHRLWLTLLLTGALAACTSPVQLDNSPPAQIEQRGTSSDGTQGGVSTRGISGGEIREGDRSVATVDASTDQSGSTDAPPADPLLGKLNIYFDYDSFTIREEFRAIVEAHARNLIANPGLHVVLQGNTDERGSREYNLALGQKRAEAVRRALTILGVNESQVEAVSFGEERPRSVSQTESAYAENRRTDIVYQ